MTVSASGLPLHLHIKAHGKNWSFDPFVALTHRISLGEFLFGNAMMETRSASVRMSAWMLGDFDRALRAFDEPELLKDALVKPVAP